MSRIDPPLQGDPALRDASPSREPATKESGPPLDPGGAPRAGASGGAASSGASGSRRRLIWGAAKLALGLALALVSAGAAAVLAFSTLA